MTSLNIGNAVEGSSLTAMSSPSAEITGINESGETEYLNDKWNELWGYFTEHSELRAALLTKTTFIVGAGYKCSPETQVILDHISGMGKDSFLDVLFNQELMKRVARDSFAQIIRADNKEKTLLNLKPLNPGSIKICLDKYGVISEYQQISRIGDKNVAIKHFKPEEIFHLSNNRLGDSVCGFSDIEGLNKELLAELESFQDTKSVMKQCAHPFIIFQAKTDDTTKLNALDAKMKRVRDKNDNYMIIPDDENILTYQVVQINPSQVLLQWRDDLRRKFYRAIGLPELIVSGGGDSTESGGKIGSLHFSQIVERDQKYLEEQCKSQLGIEINLIAPETLAMETLQQDNAKDGTNALQGGGFQPNDVQPGVGR